MRVPISINSTLITCMRICAFRGRHCVAYWLRAVELGLDDSVIYGQI